MQKRGDDVCARNPPALLHQARASVAAQQRQALLPLLASSSQVWLALERRRALRGSDAAHGGSGASI
jgi:hypothetical protein